jgi:hypothetical protein
MRLRRLHRILAAARVALFAATVAAACAASISGCLAPEDDAAPSLRFRNPELTVGMDSLHVLGANARKLDTLFILRWHKGEDFPSEVAYPPGLEAAFTMLVRGFKGGILVYASRTAIAGNKPQAQVRDFRLAAPALPDLPISLAQRVGDAIKLVPVWETRPGIYRQTDSGGPEAFTPEAVLAWSRAGQLLGRDSVLSFGSLTLADSGTYLFSAGNDAGEDSLAFQLTIRHMLPKIAEIKSQSARLGKPLKAVPAVTHSDSLLYRWIRNGITASTDSVLKFDSLRAQDTGAYQLAVANASDTTEKTLSNRFTVSLAPEPVEAWKAMKPFTVGAQANTGYGTALDLDAGQALFSGPAKEMASALELLFVFSGGKLKLMNPLVAMRTSDLDYADKFDSTKVKDVKLVVTTAKFATPAEARAAYTKGAKATSATAAAGQGYLVETASGNIAWLRIETIPGTPSSGSYATLALDIAPIVPNP